MSFVGKSDMNMDVDANVLFLHDFLCCSRFFNSFSQPLS